MAVIEELDPGSEGLMGSEADGDEQNAHEIEDDPTRMPPPPGK
jgi:hypothetical protein